jgi:hypothetical protein
VYSVDLLVITLDGVELEPRDAAHVVWSSSRILGRGALDSVWRGLNVSVVCLGAQIECGNLLGVEVVVTRDAVRSLGTSGDGVVKRKSRNVCHDAAVEARRVTCRIEKRGDRAVGNGRCVCGCRCACVVLCAAANGDVLDC